MALYRYSFLFRYVSGPGTITVGQRTAGWSESVYSNLATAAEINFARRLAQKRAAILPTTVALYGIRLQQVDPVAGAQTIPVNYTGPTGANYDKDIPQVSLKFRFQLSGIRNLKPYTLVALPDKQVVEGELQPTPDWFLGLANWLAEINGWFGRGRDLSATTYRIKSIDTAGVVTMTDPIPIGPLSTVTILRTVDAFGAQKGGNFSINAFTSGISFTLRAWPYGLTTGGTMRIYSVVSAPIINAGQAIPTIVVRKVGRPSGGYRGRRSKRKQ